MPVVNKQVSANIMREMRIQNGFFVVKLLWETLSGKLQAKLSSPVGKLPDKGASRVIKNNLKEVK